MENTTLFEGIDTIIIRVSNAKLSKQWYTNKLDFQAVWSDPNLKLIVLDTQTPTSITLWETDTSIQNDKETSSYPIFKTADAVETQRVLQNRGVNADEVTDDGAVKYFRFYDPDGNILEACQVNQ